VPASAKWRRALRTTGPLTVVANGAESEPVSGKDGTLLRQRPHLVLDGLAVLAEALGADRAVLWLHGDDDGAHRAALRAVEERHHHGTDSLPVEVVSGPHHYLAGEGSAITQALAAGPALPTARRPVDDPHAPRTLVHNVETLARLALLARGLPDPTTVLLTVVTPTGRHVHEARRTDTVADVLARTGWTVDTPPQAVLLGGYGGQWATWQQVRDVTVHEPALSAAGLSLGAGVVVPLAAGACGIAQTAQLAEYLASMSARQCGPCLFGLPSLARTLGALADGTPPAGALARLRALLTAVEGRGACHHPDGVTRLVASAVQVFGADLAAHAAGAPCLGSGRLGFGVPAAAHGAGVRR
jgi:NADH:ubiquinone oxidoreductase subunit F (NADH-binding)